MTFSLAYLNPNFNFNIFVYGSRMCIFFLMNTFGKWSIKLAISSLGNRAHCYAELAISPQLWPKLSPVLTAPTHGGMTRLNGPGVACKIPL